MPLTAMSTRVKRSGAATDGPSARGLEEQRPLSRARLGRLRLRRDDEDREGEREAHDEARGERFAREARDVAVDVTRERMRTRGPGGVHGISR